MTQKLILRHGDCVEVLKGYEDGSLGAVISDPPYGLEFMGKDWDSPWIGKASREFNHLKPGTLGGFSALPNHSRVNNTKCQICGKWKFSGTPCVCPKPDFPPARKWAMQAFGRWNQIWLTEAFRALRPGGVLKAFSGTRTFHRMAAAMAEAGFVGLRVESWNYGSGFPKSMNIGKALDKAAGVKREVVGSVFLTGNAAQTTKEKGGTYAAGTDARGVPAKEVMLTAPATEAAQRWDGWGTALKPSWEPVVVGRKPE